MLEGLKSWVRSFVAEKRTVGIPAEWQELVLGRRLDNMHASPTTALQCSALVACIRLLSTAVSSLDLGVFEIVSDGMQPAPGHPVDYVISLRPNKRQTSVEWRRDMVTRMLLWGASLDQILMNAKRDVIELNPLHPSKVKIDDEGERVYRVEQKNGTETLLPDDQVLYIPFLFEGKSLFEHARRAVGLAMSADEFANRFFTSGGVTQLKIEADQLVAKDKKKEIVETFHENLALGRIPFFDSGAKLNSMNVKFEEAQLKDTRLHQLRDIARVFGVQPHLIGDLERSTNNNIEHQGIEFVQFTALPILKAIEQRLDVSLFGPRESIRFAARFNRLPLQQPDYESTADAVSKFVTSGIMTSNEARDRIGLNRHPEGGRLLIQGAMVPIASVDQQQESNNANQ